MLVSLETPSETGFDLFETDIAMLFGANDADHATEAIGLARCHSERLRALGAGIIAFPQQALALAKP